MIVSVVQLKDIGRNSLATSTPPLQDLLKLTYEINI